MTKQVFKHLHINAQRKLSSEITGLTACGRTSSATVVTVTELSEVTCGTCISSGIFKLRNKAQQTDKVSNAIEDIKTFTSR